VPEAPAAIYDAFQRAKDGTAAFYARQAAKQHMALMTPWFSALYSRNIETLGEDWWPYGVRKNRTAVDTFLRYAYRQGLTKDLLTCDDIVVPSMLNT